MSPSRGLSSLAINICDESIAEELILVTETYTRRTLLNRSAAATAAFAAAQFSARLAVGVDYTEPVSEAAGLTGYLNGANALVRLDDEIVLGYRAHKSLKYPYFAPLAGPVSGASLTSESAQAQESGRFIPLADEMPGVSRRHCSVIRLNAQCVVEDHSRYGTFVNGHRINGSTVLQIGDSVRIGSPGFEFQLITMEKGHGA